MYVIGIDIGGMSIKVGLVDDNGNIIEQLRFKTGMTADECVKGMIDTMNDLLKNNALTKNDIKGIGVGCPGAVDSKTGVIKYLPNLTCLNDYPLCKVLMEHFETTVIASNDANVATLGEVRYGAAKEYESAVMFTLGTGVGGGIVLNGKLFDNGATSVELGHVPLVVDGVRCGCGKNGCIESYVSATALMRQTREEMLKNKESKMWEYVNGDIKNVSGVTAFDCEKLGDKSAKIVVDNYVKYLSESIIGMLNIFRPQAFILGGGVSNQGDNLVKRVKEYIEKYNYGLTSAPKSEILVATLKNDAGIIGAAALID